MAPPLPRTPAPLSAQLVVEVASCFATPRCAKAGFSVQKPEAATHATRCLAGPSNIHIPPNTAQTKQKTGASIKGSRSDSRPNQGPETLSAGAFGVSSTVAVHCLETFCMRSHFQSYHRTEFQQASVREDRKSYLSRCQLCCNG